MWLTGIMPRINHREYAMPWCVLPRHQTRPRRRTIRRTGVGLSESNALAGQAIKVWRFNKVVPRKTYVSLSHVVHEDQHDIRRGGMKSILRDAEDEHYQEAGHESH